MSGWTGSSGHVDVEVDDGIAVLRLNRPDKLNALSIPMLADVAGALRRFGSGDETGGVILTGAGRAFSAGDDLPATDELRESDFDELLTHFQDLTRLIVSAEVPVVAALNGISVGGAAEMVLACDARVGHPGSEFLFPENDVGLTISNGSSYLLPRLVGSRALPFVLDARRLSGAEAHALGLIDYMVDTAGGVVPHAVRVVHRWIERGLATRWHLKLLRPPLGEIEAAIQRENEIGAEAWRSGAAREGIRRFMAEQEAKRTR